MYWKKEEEFPISYKLEVERETKNHQIRAFDILRRIYRSEESIGVPPDERRIIHGLDKILKLLPLTDLLIFAGNHKSDSDISQDYSKLIQACLRLEPNADGLDILQSYQHFLKNVNISKDDGSLNFNTLLTCHIKPEYFGDWPHHYGIVAELFLDDGGRGNQDVSENCEYCKVGEERAPSIFRIKRKRVISYAPLPQEGLTAEAVSDIIEKEEGLDFYEYATRLPYYNGERERVLVANDEYYKNSAPCLEDMIKRVKHMSDGILCAIEKDKESEIAKRKKRIVKALSI